MCLSCCSLHHRFVVLVVSCFPRLHVFFFSVSPFVSSVHFFICFFPFGSIQVFWYQTSDISYHWCPSFLFVLFFFSFGFLVFLFSLFSFSPSFSSFSSLFCLSFFFFPLFFFFLYCK